MQNLVHWICRTLSASEISGRLETSFSHTSRLLGAVEDKGYIFRTLGTKDRRKIYFSLTQEGKDKLDTVNKECENIIPANLLIKGI